MLAAAAAWDGLAADLAATASSYQSAVSGLTSAWSGPSAISMASAAAPYVAWLTSAAEQAEQTAAQARAAASAYETAFAMTVPPPVIAANRSLLMTLIATNILGQNTPAIAATEAHYAEMWAQDAAAMYGYAGSSAAATQLAPFTEPPQTTNPAGAAGQAAAVTQATSSSASSKATQLSQLITSMPTALQTLATGITESPTTGSTNLLSGLSLPTLFNLQLPPGLSTDLANWNTIWSTLTGPFSPQSWSTIPGGPFLSFGQAYAWGQNGQGAAAWLAGPKPPTGALAPLGDSLKSVVSPTGLGTGPVSGAMGRAAVVGSLSVPQGWTTAAPAIRTLAATLPTNVAAAPVASLSGEEGVFSQMALSSLAGRGIAAAATRPVGGLTASSLGSVTAEAEPATATIIVIPAVEE
ncbi:PPE family protein [Mycobacterium heckeshornense]|uniref:PPE family protein n=2 Tax=Mycobacterium heckeshornense TaxID=110505 RepID=A0A7R7TXC4_9MYCO|nr:PPE family protein [Mycobacterium heckeshornense]BCQ09109.1 PPE family protein [Mycobacterium heckeshornense]